jgi:hypothetical protein
MFDIANRKLIEKNCYLYLILAVLVTEDAKFYKDEADRYRVEADDWRSKLQLLVGKSIMCYISICY